MADERSDSMKAVNTSLTPPEEDLRRERDDFPGGPVHEHVPVKGNPDDAGSSAQPGQAAADADAPRVPDSMIADEIASNAAAGGGDVAPSGDQ
jgi:hypothetical protein